jgi:glycosyltransferase involved in cell wall biosynthesis
VKPYISVIIPALDEEEPIGDVVRSCLTTGLPNEVIVVDNGSTDNTFERAQDAGARVITAPRGYGRACAAGAAAVDRRSEILVFLDGDGSDCPQLMARLVTPIATGSADFVVGSRLRGEREPGSMNLSQIFAGRLAGFLLSRLYRVKFSDMCPFRAIRRDALQRLGMREETYGWNLEMQMRAARAGLRIMEVPVDHRCRAGGRSKVSGTCRGAFVAGARIITTLLRVSLERRSATDGRY